ncbi:MAG: MBL fold metallo-hydrolase [bacterium]|nr:MBL fold metallo-hydrolase [bacterium]
MQTMPNQFTVHFWGVRGSIACPGSGTVRHGGNTPCVEMMVGGRRLIFDGGTGMRVLGNHLARKGPVEAHMFFTHTHWDHIQGFPFFQPAFVEGNTFHIHDPSTAEVTLQQSLSHQMRDPHFPVPLREMNASLHFVPLEVGETVTIDDAVVVESAPLNHPGGAAGYRVNFNGHAAAYITDTEHYPDRLDENVLRLARNADVVVYDGTYTDDEYHSTESSKVGWGHSTWQEAVKMAKAAGVRQLVIFHHDPLHDDDFLDDIGEALVQEFPGSVMAREGLSIQLGAGGV